MQSMKSMVERIDLKDYRDLTEEEARAALSIRNEPQVRNGMYDPHEISWEEHLAWLAGLKQSERSRIFAIMYEGVLVGSVGLTSISRPDRRADWTFHLSSQTMGKGLGSAVEYRFLNFVFEELGFEKLNCEVLDFNQAVVKLHKKFGFLEEGLRRSHIERDNRRHDTFLLGITRDEWSEKRPELEARLFR